MGMMLIINKLLTLQEHLDIKLFVCFIVVFININFYVKIIILQNSNVYFLAVTRLVAVFFKKIFCFGDKIYIISINNSLSKR